MKGQVEVDGVCESPFWLGAAGVCVCLQRRLTKMEGRQEGGGETHDTSSGETGFQTAVTREAGLRPAFTLDAQATCTSGPSPHPYLPQPPPPPPPPPVASATMTCDDGGGF